MIHTLLTLTAVILYLGAALAIGARLARRVADGTTQQAALAAAWTGALVHGVLVWRETWTAEGLNLALFNAASLITWLMTLMLLLAVLRRPLASLGILVFPIAAVAVVLAALFGIAEAPRVPIGAPLDVHVLLSVAAYSVLGLATAQAVVLAVQEHHLRSRQLGGFLRMLPPLQSMESLLFQLLAYGFVLLSLALATGWAFVDDLFAQSLVHKTTLTVLAWAIFGVLLIGRWSAGWRGQTAIRWTLGGFATLGLGYFGSKLVLELILGR